MTADEIIKKLQLEPLPQEGGFYRETYRSTTMIDVTNKGTTLRSLMTIIYYLITPLSKSLIHRLKSDEMFFFHLGSPVVLMLLYKDKRGEIVTLGTDLNQGQKPHAIIPKGTWFGASMLDTKAQYSLLSTTVSPGFDFDDYEHGRRDELLATYPNYSDIIIELTNSLDI
jgi:predicted cupin superfamily sugar epimerase